MTERLRIAVACFPTFGGSGLIASEVALAMAVRGHEVHVVAPRLPVRLQGASDVVRFHAVSESDYTLLMGASAYPIALASKLIEVAGRARLDVLHVHYAVPHATAAWMAREVLGEAAPAVVTTLHGTDITLVGADPGYLPITRFSIVKSDAVTAPSEFLRRATHEILGVPEDCAVEVVPNFVDTARWAPRAPGDRAPLAALFPDLREDEGVLAHVSNFRPVKRIGDVVAAFAVVARRARCRLVMIGDGPERAAAEAEIARLGLADRAAFLGEQEGFEALLGACDVFLLPSETESFGLAALEAQSCGVPVVASEVGGVPEVVVHGETGLLAQVGDVEAMAGHALKLLVDPARRSEMGRRARERVLDRFRLAPAVDRYEEVYRRVLRRSA